MTIWLHMRSNFRETFSERASEWACAIMITMWALRVDSIPDLFQTAGAFENFSRLAPQSWWVVGALAIGLARLLALAINGMWRRSYHARGITAFFTCFFWMQITWSFFTSDNSTTSIAIYPVLLALDTFHVLRAAVEARRSDDRNKLHGRASHNGGTI
jgi:hypothetical protein